MNRRPCRPATRRHLQLAQGRQLHAQAADARPPVVQAVHLAGGHRCLGAQKPGRSEREAEVPLRRCHGSCRRCSAWRWARPGAHETGVLHKAAPASARGALPVPAAGHASSPVQRGRSLRVPEGAPHPAPPARRAGVDKVSGHGPQFVIDGVHRPWRSGASGTSASRMAQPADRQPVHAGRIAHASAVTSAHLRLRRRAGHARPCAGEATRWLIGGTHGRGPVYDCDGADEGDDQGKPFVGGDGLGGGRRCRINRLYDFWSRHGQVPQSA